MSAPYSRPDEAAWTGWKGYTFDGLGRLTRTFEDGTLPDTAGIPKSDATGDDVAALAGQVSAQRWSYVREAAVGSVLRIEAPAFGTNAPPPPRFVAPSRGPGHQLTQYTLDDSVTRAVTHDGAGRLASNGLATYRWDDFDALVAVEAGSGVEGALQYDGLGRLVARHNRNRLEEELAWDGAQLVAAYDAAGAATWTATWGPGVDNLVSVAQGGAEYLALSDGKGSVAGYYRAEDNRLVAAADYTPEGRAAVVDFEAGTACVESGATRCGRLAGLPFGFHSAYQSPATGLLYFRNRWYSPEAAQWLSQDALGFVDSFSLYAFNGFDAVNFRDPWGLSGNGVADDPEGPRPGESVQEWCKRTGAYCEEELVLVGDSPVCDAECQRAEKFQAQQELREAKPSRVLRQCGESSYCMDPPNEPAKPNRHVTPRPPKKPPTPKIEVRPLKNLSKDELKKIFANLLSKDTPNITLGELEAEVAKLTPSEVDQMCDELCRAERADGARLLRELWEEQKREANEKFYNAAGQASAEGVKDATEKIMIVGGSRVRGPRPGGPKIPKVLNVSEKQFGKKLGQKARELGLDPANARDRYKLRHRIQRVFDNAEEVRTNMWRGVGEGGREGQAIFFRRGSDVVVTTPGGDFVTLLPGGASNARFVGGQVLW